MYIKAAAIKTTVRIILNKFFFKIYLRLKFLYLLKYYAKNEQTTK